jgi:hypothetical protein
MARLVTSTPTHGLARAAWYSICDAADIVEMLVISLLTGGAATAAACALASLVLWLARAARAAVVRAGKRLAITHKSRRQAAFQERYRSSASVRAT